MTLANHYFAPPNPSSNKSQQSCVDCGKVPAMHPPNPDLERDIEDERRIKEYAAGLYPGNQIGVGRYIAHAEARAHDGPVRDANTRDFDTDGIEEASDWTNYLVWRIQQLDRLEPAQPAKRLAYCHALVKVYEAWQAVEIAQHESD